MPVYCSVCGREHEDIWVLRRFWISVVILLLSIGVWAYVRGEHRAAEYRHQQYTECIQIHGDGAGVCQKWASEW